MFTPKLTACQEREMFKKLVKGASTKEMAQEYGVSENTVRRVKYSPKRLAEAEKSMDAHQRFLKLRIHEGAIKGVKKEHEILDREVPEGAKGTSLLYLQHQVAHALMDRDGLKPKTVADSNINITFGGQDVEVGMPPENDIEVEEDGADDGEEPEEADAT